MSDNLLAIDDIADDFKAVLEWAIAFKNDEDFSYDFKPLDGMSIGSIYEKPSTRTRVSFETGIHKLGGQPLTLLKGDIQIGKSETVGDTAQVLSRFLDGLTYRCFAHADVEELAEKASVPVINALSDKHHPCQAAADLMTMMEKDPKLNNTRVAWVGDGNNVLHDLMLGCAILGVDCTWAVPEGYEPDEDIVKRAKKIAKGTGCTMKQTHNPKKAVKNATIIYTDAFVSMGEEDQVDKMADFDGFQVNMELLEAAEDDWSFMHCLPAHRGDEVTDEVMDHKQSIVFDQAENRMWAQMSLITYLCNKAAWETLAEFLDL
jgi:ornithine carbamoyltransferase